MKIFVKDPPSLEGTFSLDRKARKRIVTVMRKKLGDAVQIYTPGQAWEAVISNISSQAIELRTLRPIPYLESSGIHLTLAQAIPKGDRFEWLIQKNAELGVSEIIPLLTERTIVKPGNTSAKLQRWNEIADHAAAQGENVHPLLVRPPQPLREFLESQRNGIRLLLHEREGASSLREVLSRYDDHNITVLVGPEGGWTTQESSSIRDAGYVSIHLGPRILRSETAGLVLAAILQYERGDFS